MDASRAPENYGYNIIPLTVRPGGTTVGAHFKGIAGAEGYRAIKTDKAGWRCGFVALTGGGERVYGEMNNKAEADMEFTIPEGTTNLWFVVTGAPTEHWRHAWDDDTSNDEQWPYEVTFSETDLQGYFTPDVVNRRDMDVDEVVNIKYQEGATMSGRVTVNYDVLAECFGLSADGLKSKIKNTATDSLCVFGVDTDGLRVEGTTSNMVCYLADGSLTEYVGESDDIAIYASYIGYYNGFYVIANGRKVHPGDSYTFRIGIRYRPSDEERSYYATYTITANITE